MNNQNGKENTIFVVDDNSKNLGVTTAFLKDAGYDVAVASGGIRALERVERVEPAVILLDINMPEMDGFEVCRKLKKNAKTRDVPVLFMTAYDDIKSITKGFKVGAVDYIIKPVKKGELLARVLTHMENYIYKNKMEEDVRIRTKQIEESKEELLHLRNFLYNIINSMPSVLVGVDVDGKVTQWNNTAEQTTGIAADIARGRVLSDVFPPLASEMKKVIESIRKKEIKLEQKKPRLSNDNTLYEDLTIYPLIANGVDGAVIRIDDVTEKVRMEEMLIQSEKMISVGGLAAGMAHEINNPLAGIMQNMQVAMGRFSSSLPKNIQVAEELGISMEAIEKYLEKRKINTIFEGIMDSSVRAAKIVKNMLRFSRKSESVLEPQNISTLLTETVDLARNDHDLKNKFDFRQIDIVKEYEENLPEILCESGEIQQVFFNIIQNAAQAMAEKHKTLSEDTQKTQKLMLRIRKQEKTIQIEIEDNGPGMSDKIRRRIFEPFFTTKIKGSGTGLGLSVSYFIIAENHKGTMTVESKIGKGTKFIIELPLKPDSKIDAQNN